MKKHWTHAGLAREFETALPRSQNLSRDEETMSGTSHRDAVAFLYPRIKGMYVSKAFKQIQEILVASIARLITKELQGRRVPEYRNLTYRMRLELAQREGILRPEVFLSLTQMEGRVETEAETTHLLAVFLSFLRSIQHSELQFEPFLSKATTDKELTPLDPVISFLNREFEAVLA